VRVADDEDRDGPRRDRHRRAPAARGDQPRELQQDLGQDERDADDRGRA